MAGDGTRIRSTVYLPSEPRPGVQQESRFGTVVNFSPYYATYGGDTDSRLEGVGPDFPLNQTGPFGLALMHGFAYVAASVPGTGNSGGCYDLGGLHEQQIMAEFVDWVGSQPWSNGNVGMAGGGYPGTAQWMAAIHNPVHLKTIVPHVGWVDWYDFLFHDGAAYAGSDPTFSPSWDAAFGYGIYTGTPPTAQLPVEMLSQRLCPDVAQHLLDTSKGFTSAAYDDFWRERDYRQHLGRIQASVFLVHGLADWSSNSRHSLVWDELETEKAFWLQQMGTQMPNWNPDKPEWRRFDYNKTLVAWYDHYLNGADNEIQTLLPAVQVQDQAGQWRNETRWPPETASARFFLGVGSLNEEASAGQTIIATVPRSAEAEGVEAGVDDPDLEAPVVAKFLTPPLSDGLRFSGVPLLNLSLMVDRPGNAHITAQLWSVHANGDWEFLAFGGRGLGQRLDRERNDPVTPMQRIEVPIEFTANDVHVAPGDRLALTLAGENHWFAPSGHLPTFFVQHESTLTVPLLPARSPVGVDTATMMARNPYHEA